MPDISSDLLPRIQDHRIAGVDLGDGLIYPNYQGLSILNIPSSICHWMGVPGLGAPALIPEIISAVDGRIRKVILVLMDALALHRFQRWLISGDAPAWPFMLDEGILAALTSITPSTTSAALTSLWTGRAPFEHGILGYEMWLKEYGIVANTILHSPIAYQGQVGSLSHAGFSPENFMTLPTLGTHLASHGVSAYAFQHYTIARSGLSRMFFNDVDVHSFSTAADLWIDLRQLIEDKRDDRLYTWVYWGQIDYLSHFHGPDDERPAAEFHLFSEAMERNFLDQLSLEERQDTLLILTADHGQIGTVQDPHYELRNHPELTKCLHILPSGENRLAYLFVRPGRSEQVMEYISANWPGKFAIVDPLQAAARGLFGSGSQHPALDDRLGDYMLVALNDAYLWWTNKNNILIGRHGGLHPEEMLVPFLATRLG